MAIFCFLLIFAFAPYIVLGPTVAEEVYGGAGFYGVLAARDGRGDDRRRADRPALAPASGRC